MKGKLLIAASVATLTLAAAWWIARRQEDGAGASYGGKTAAEWFFGHRTNFFGATQRSAAEAAFKAMGTNGLPFLLRQLERRESWLNSIYFKAYPRLPRLIQRRTPCPISQSDVQLIALQHLDKSGPLPAHWIEKLTVRVVAVEDELIRYRGMQTVLKLSGTPECKPQVIGMLNRLLQDPHFLIRLDAALELMRRDCITTNAFPVLLDCIADYQFVSRSLAIRGYRYGLPPNSTNRTVGTTALVGRGLRLPDQPTLEQTEALRALVLIEPSLDRTCRERLWLTFGELPLKTPPEWPREKVGLFPDDVEKRMGMRFKDGIRLLISLLNDPDPSRRARAAKALRWFGQRASEAIPALKRALDDPSDEVRSAAQAALSSMTGENGH